MSATESPAEILERLAAERQAKRPELPKGKPIAITGGRDHMPTASELQAFRFCFGRLGGTVLLHGDARGVDRTVAAYARRHGIPVQAFPADWNRFGKAGGPLRNQEIVTECHALIAWPGNIGTQDCIAKARRLGRPVHLIADELELLRLDIQRR